MKGPINRDTLLKLMEMFMSDLQNNPDALAEMQKALNCLNLESNEICELQPEYDEECWTLSVQVFRSIILFITLSRTMEDVSSECDAHAFSLILGLLLEMNNHNGESEFLRRLWHAAIMHTLLNREFMENLLNHSEHDKFIQPLRELLLCVAISEDIKIAVKVSSEILEVISSCSQNCDDQHFLHVSKACMKEAANFFASIGTVSPFWKARSKTSGNESDKFPRKKILKFSHIKYFKIQKANDTIQKVMEVAELLQLPPKMYTIQCCYPLELPFESDNLFSIMLSPEQYMDSDSFDIKTKDRRIRELRTTILEFVRLVWETEHKVSSELHKDLCSSDTKTRWMNFLIDMSIKSFYENEETDSSKAAHAALAALLKTSDVGSKVSILFIKKLVSAIQSDLGITHITEEDVPDVEFLVDNIDQLIEKKELIKIEDVNSLENISLMSLISRLSMLLAIPEASRAASIFMKLQADSLMRRMISVNLQRARYLTQSHLDLRKKLLMNVKEGDVSHVKDPIKLAQIDLLRFLQKRSWKYVEESLRVISNTIASVSHEDISTKRFIHDWQEVLSEVMREIVSICEACDAIMGSAAKESLYQYNTTSLHPPLRCSNDVYFQAYRGLNNINALRELINGTESNINSSFRFTDYVIPLKVSGIYDPLLQPDSKFFYSQLGQHKDFAKFFRENNVPMQNFCQKILDLSPKFPQSTITNTLNEESDAIDIVLVHGLRGGAFRTWRHGMLLLPEDCLYPSLPSGSRLNNNSPVKSPPPGGPSWKWALSLINLMESERHIDDSLCSSEERTKLSSCMPLFPKLKGVDRKIPPDDVKIMREQTARLETHNRLRGAWYTLWPRTMLCPHLKSSTRVIAAHFESPVFSQPRQFRFESTVLKEGSVREVTWMNIEETSHLLGKNLKLAGVAHKNKGKRRKIVWITHSMGGLIVKHMLLNNPDLAQSTLAIAFYGTPHFGSPLADIPTFLYKHVAPCVLDLRTENMQLRELNDKFTNLAQSHKWSIVSFSETRVSPLPLKLPSRICTVPPSSADPRCGLFFPIVGAQHTEICKPSEPADPRFWLLWEYVLSGISI
eukprot:GHVL01033830.1.p1 GENE.GHVL01033830.1~~GHVL01033830.1.p1  ORF type:complete len:1076 (+),score=135.08 GHVL01033830.1:416-3643(+)